MREAVYGHDVAGRVGGVTVEEVVGCGGVVCVQVAWAAVRRGYLFIWIFELYLTFKQEESSVRAQRTLGL